jgi:surfactin synthase thioesterase subunit
VVCATGFVQEVPFLDEQVQRKLHDERGYNSSFFSPLNAEMAALWIAADLAGQIPLPTMEQRRQAVVEQLAFMDVATNTPRLLDRIATTTAAEPSTFPGFSLGGVVAQSSGNAELG